MNIQVNTDLIEIARLESLVNQVANELVELSDPNDTITEIQGNSIQMIYAGRGSEQIELFLSDKYRNKTRIAYQSDVLSRLTEIKNYILEGLAA
ncbi:hypothetical protein ACG94X_14215 [Acinetobacter sp. ULE_I010]|uniref:hypothetical protein n=1 Tax=Acinetobacter sp. ULE_I010 TaxID=3373065 RepID=UPI003AF85CF1